MHVILVTTDNFWFFNLFISTHNCLSKLPLLKYHEIVEILDINTVSKKYKSQIFPPVLFIGANYEKLLGGNAPLGDEMGVLLRNLYWYFIYVE